MTTKVTFNLPDKTVEDIKYLADRWGTTVTGAFTRVIEDHRFLSQEAARGNKILLDKKVVIPFPLNFWGPDYVHTRREVFINRPPAPPALRSGKIMSGESAKKENVQVGDEMEDGTILAGYYEGKPLYTTPKDAPGTYTFNEAARYAKNLYAHCHNDFHAPSKGELNVLYENRNKGKLKGTFNETGSNPAGWYWSSSRADIILGWAQSFSNGYRVGNDEYVASSLRCVR